MIKDQEVARCSQLDPQAIPHTYRRHQEERAQLAKTIQQREVLASIQVRPWERAAPEFNEKVMVPFFRINPDQEI